MLRLQKTIFILTLSAIATGVGNADVLRMPDPQPQAEQQTVLSVEMPARGMTMERVEELFGTPVEKVPAVGEPPISRWIYNDFVVYFEHQWVLNSVVTRGVEQP